VHELARVFLDAVADAARPAFADAAQLATTLVAHLAAARAAWPGVTIEDARFAGELARRLGDGATPARLEAMRAADVYLAVACGDGDARAIAACLEVLAAEVAFAAPRTSATAAQIADVAAELRRVVFVDEPERAAAVREYTGRGDLRSYLRVIAMRALIRAVTAGRREVPADGLLEKLVPARDPELSVLRAQYREIVDAALRAALAALDERSRALLRYQLIEGWSVEQIGRAYDVHRTTAWRWVEAVRSELGDRIRSELAARLSLATDELDSIIQLVRSRVDVSIERVLGG
jgi:RNA polymerase sigma-70 factor, ECF subfamily